MITVLVEELEFSAIIGLLDFERVKEQKVRVSAKFRAEEFIDYALVCETIKEDFKKEKFLKVEDALSFFENKFKEKYKSLNCFYMKIIKLEILPDAKVGASIEKSY
ncbi:MAG: dihydroneopterin aldolase [Campylobacteraceae bacterium]|nr:dihydroneopterin aldolase [Campylobacteraceae bacterium]